jgi:hypothetical protein
MKGEKKPAMEIEKKGSAASRCLPNASSGQSSGGDGGGEAVAALKCQKLAEGDKAEAGKGKRIAQVSQKYIDLLLKAQATSAGVYRVSRSKECLDMYKGPDEAELRALVARSEAARERVRAGDAKILEQYHRDGKAFAEVEEDDSFVYDRPFAKSRPPVPPA